MHIVREVEENIYIVHGDPANLVRIFVYINDNTAEHFALIYTCYPYMSIGYNPVEPTVYIDIIAPDGYSLDMLNAYISNVQEVKRIAEELESEVKVMHQDWLVSKI